MFLGHYAVALAAKKASPETSLGTLVLAAQFLDFLWPALVLVGVEHVRIDPGNTTVTPLDFYDYPLSHSLLMVAGWSILAGGILFAIRRRVREAVVIGLCVASHWVLDFLTHRPDLPLAPGNAPSVGLGLWNSLAGTLIVELGLFAAGVAVYLRATSPRDRIGSIGFYALIAILTVIYLANMFGPPPPDVMSIAVVANAAWLFVLLAWWIDRHRVSSGVTA